MIDVRVYQRERQKPLCRKWFAGLNVHVAAKITAVLEKLAKGNVSNVEAVGDGVSEYKLDWGPGYRVYFGNDGDRLVILVGGGMKKRQFGRYCRRTGLLGGL